MKQFLWIQRVALWLVFLFGVPSMNAGDRQFLRESIRARGMGNAFTAVANDETVLFYNPAGLRSIHYHIYELLTISATTNENTLKIAQDISDSETENALSRIVGKKLWLELDLAALNHLNSRFGWSLFGNSLLDIQVRNPVVPYLDVRAYVQGGILGGMAWSFMDRQLDIGVGMKAIHRTGLDKDLHIFDEAILAAINDSDTSKLKKEYSSTNRFSPDFGAIYHIDSWYNVEPKFALTIMNIGGMDFGKAGKIPMTINVGVATESEFQGIDVITALDYQDLSNAQDLASEGSTFTLRNLKMGVEAGLEKLFNGHHLFSGRFGFNGPYTTFGVSVNLFGFKIDYADWGEEIGQYAGAIEDRRRTLQISFIF